MGTDATDGCRPISPQQAAQLLSAVLGRHAPPLDRLLARCAAADGTSWSSEVLGSLQGETTSLEACCALKDRAKEALSQLSEEGHDPAAFLRYLCAIAAAADMFDTTISSAAPDELARGLASVAPRLSKPWHSMFLRAAQRIRD